MAQPAVQGLVIPSTTAVRSANAAWYPPENIHCVDVFRADASLWQVPASIFAPAFQILFAIAQRMALCWQRQSATALSQTPAASGCSCILYPIREGGLCCW